MIATSLAASGAGALSCDSEALADPRREGAPRAASTAAVPTVAAAPVAGHVVGRYRFVGGQAQRDAVLDAIDEVVAEMNMLARGIARDRLREANPVPSEVSITHDESTITIAIDGRQYKAPLDGSFTEVEGITGDTLRYRVSIAGDQIGQTFIGPKGTRKNTLHVREDGKLGMRVEVSSESLPKALQYRLSFRRSS